MTSSTNWEKAVLPPSANVQDALKNLETTGCKVVLVADDSKRFYGVVTDGDIRRGFLNGKTVKSGIIEVLNKTPLVVAPEVSQETVQSIMISNEVHQVPIVENETNKVLGVHLFGEDNLSEPIENFMVIMAGGRGTRLLPHTENCPKPMLPLSGKPMLEHIILRAVADGFKEFIIAIHYLGEMIEQYFGSGEKWGVNISYLREEEPLGTAGAITLLPKKIDKAFIVTNGDVLTDVSYNEILNFHLRHEASATMAVKLHEWQHPFGVVKTNGLDIVGFEEKPINQSHINAGIYVIDPKILKYIERDKRCDMPALFNVAKANGEKSIVYPMHEPWLDVGRISEYKNAQKTIS